jgi:hypothetical protein
MAAIAKHTPKSVKVRPVRLNPSPVRVRNVKPAEAGGKTNIVTCLSQLGKLSQ